MLRLAYKLVLLATTVVITVTIIVVISPRDPNHYMAEALDKYHYLNSVGSPKIILVGGSNVAFGVDSEKIEIRFGIPVVNMGHHAGLGLRFMLNEIKPALGDGDIVIISPEYSHLNGDLEGSSEALGAEIKYCPECALGLSTPSDIFNMSKGILQMSERDIRRIFVRSSAENEVEIFGKSDFNQWGDMIGHLDQPDKRMPDYDSFSEIQVTPNNYSTRFLNSFYQLCRAKNVQVFFMFPPIPITTYHAQEKNIIASYDLLKKELNIPILGTPQDFIFPREFVYDTGYHLNRIGREERTNRMIELLSHRLEN